MAAPRILVTGATGFVGRALVRRLSGIGVDPGSGVEPSRIRCLVRDPDRAARAGLATHDLAVGSLEDPQSLRRALDGVTTVYHLAGATRALSRSGFFRVNDEGTAALVAALRERAPGARVVHVSSLAAAGPSVDGSRTALPPQMCAPCSHYGRSKLAGERHVVGLGDAQPWIVLRPPVVYGPGDAGTRLLFRQALASLAVVPFTPRPLSLMHVEDVARAVQLAGESPLSRRILPLDGPERLDTDRLVSAIGRACGVRVRRVRVPMLFVRGAALLADAWARLRRRSSFFSYDKVREIAARGWVADPAPAREQLGFAAVWSATQGLRATAEALGLVRGTARDAARGAAEP